MDGRRAGGIVDMQPPLDEQCPLDGQETGDPADHDRGTPAHEGTRRADPHEASEQTVAHHAEVGLAETQAGMDGRPHASRGGGEHRVDRGHGDSFLGVGQGRPAEQAEPASRQDQRTKDHHRAVVGRNRPHLAAQGVLAESRPQHLRRHQRNGAAAQVNDGRAGVVHDAVTEAERPAERREPAVSPDPGPVDRIDDGGRHERQGRHGAQSRALGHRARGNGRYDDRGHRAQNEEDAGRARHHAGIEEESPPANQAEDVAAQRDREPMRRHRIRPARPRPALQPKAQRPESQDRDTIGENAHGHGVGRVFRADQSGAEKGEAGLYQ